MNTYLDMDIINQQKTQIHFLLDWAEKQPHTTYLVQPLPNGQVIHYTWAKVAQQVRCMAAYLRSLGLPERSHIAIYGKNSAHWLMADYAIWMAGYVSVPIYCTSNAEGVRYILDHSDAKLLFIGKLDGETDSWNEVKNIISKDLPCVRLMQAPEYDAPIWDELFRHSAPIQDIDLPNENDLATIMYTSGSSGLPKGVMHSFKTMLSATNELKKTYGVSTQDRMLSYLPLAHAAERIFIETFSLVGGTTVYFADSVDTFIQDLNRAKPTLFVSVPRLWTRFYIGLNAKIPLVLQHFIFKIPLLGNVFKKNIIARLGLNHVRYAFTGSAPIPPQTMKWYRDLGLDLLEVYGMSENFTYSHITRPNSFKEGYVGHAQLNVACRIDPSNNEILVKSPGTMLGYYKNSEKYTQNITNDGFLRTGDLGELDETGCLKVIGRLKDVFQTSKGKNIIPVPIEQKIGNHPLIELVCVGGAGHTQPIAYVMLDKAQAPKTHDYEHKAKIEQELMTFLINLNTQLDFHEKIDFIVIIKERWRVENGLLTPTMKIRRSMIEQRYNPYFNEWIKQQKFIIWE